MLRTSPSTSRSILVTGAAGFIGSHLVERMLASSYEVIGLDNFDDCYSTAIKWNNIRAAQKNSNFRLEQGDVRDSILLTRLFEANNIDTVVHLAARAGVTPSLKQPQLYQDINVGGTVNLLEASRTFGVKRFIFASSSSVYGSSGKTPFRETTSVDCPVSPYAASKAAGELFCRTYSQLYDLRIVIIRPFTVYGPRQRPEMAISRFVRMVHQGEQVTIFGDGTSSRDYTFIDDIVAGLESALAYNGEAFQIFNLGGGRTVGLNYLVQVIEEALGKKADVVHIAPPLGEVPITLADITKAKSLLGYQPKTPIEKGIPIFVKWYLNNGR